MMQRLKNYLYGHLLRVLIPQDVITDRKDSRIPNAPSILYLGDSLITETELQSLQSEIKALDSMRIWSILNETVKEKAYEKGWVTSTTMEHLNTAKTMHYTLDIQKSIIDIIRNKNLTQKK